MFIRDHQEYLAQLDLVDPRYEMTVDDASSLSSLPLVTPFALSHSLSPFPFLTFSPYFFSLFPFLTPSPHFFSPSLFFSSLLLLTPFFHSFSSLFLPTPFCPSSPHSLSSLLFLTLSFHSLSPSLSSFLCTE